jgi:hypothetical protein
MCITSVAPRFSIALILLPVQRVLSTDRDEQPVDRAGWVTSKVNLVVVDAVHILRAPKYQFCSEPADQARPVGPSPSASVHVVTAAAWTRTQLGQHRALSDEQFDQKNDGALADQQSLQGSPCEGGVQTADSTDRKVSCRVEHVRILQSLCHTK